MDSESDTDSFIVPHGHLSDDELNEDEQQQVKIKNEFYFQKKNKNLCFFLSLHRQNKPVKQLNHIYGIRKSHV
jgi:hypothetical protein